MARGLGRRVERSKLKVLSPYTVEWRKEKAAQEFSDLLRELLRESGLTCVEVAARAGLGQAHISQILTNKTVPTLKTIGAIMTGLGKDFKIVPTDMPISEGVS